MLRKIVKIHDNLLTPWVRTQQSFPYDILKGTSHYMCQIKIKYIKITFGGISVNLLVTP